MNIFPISLKINELMIFDKLFYLQLSNDVYLEFANKMFITKNLTLNPMFEQLSKYIFHSRISQIDTTNPKEAANVVNDWVDENMNHMINNIVDLGKLEKIIK